MTDEQRIQEITARCEAATKGPWEIKRNPAWGTMLDVDSETRSIAFFQHECDSKFSAYAREDIPWLLERLAQVERERDAVEIVRCCECRFKDHVLCRAAVSIKYDLRREKHTYKTFMEPDGFCSIGERGVRGEESR